MFNNLKDKYKKFDNDELVIKSQQNDRLALEELLKRNQKNIYNTLYHLDPKRTDMSDLVQEAMYRVAKSIKSLKQPGKFKVWLNQIITNLFYDELRRKSRQLPTLSMDDNSYEHDEETLSKTKDIADTAKLPDEKTLGRELNKKIQEAVDNLPEQFRLVIVLREVQGLSYEEIAEITKTNIGTVKSRLARARAKLQEKMKPYLE